MPPGSAKGTGSGSEVLFVRDIWSAEAGREAEVYAPEPERAGMVKRPWTGVGAPLNGMNGRGVWEFRFGGWTVAEGEAG